MNTIGWIVAIVVALILLFLVFKFITSCLPKIIIGLLILGAAAFIIFRFFV